MTVLLFPPFPGTEVLSWRGDVPESPRSTVGRTRRLPRTHRRVGIPSIIHAVTFLGTGSQVLSFFPLWNLWDGKRRRQIRRGLVLASGRAEAAGIWVRYSGGLWHLGGWLGRGWIVQPGEALHRKVGRAFRRLGVPALGPALCVRTQVVPSEDGGVACRLT